MDDLDRLAFRLVRTIRQHYPQLRDRGFTFTDLEERLLPYREARREMADSGADAWERTLLRLMSGERGYLQAEAALQQGCAHALTLPSPTLAQVRAWSGSALVLGAAAVEVGTERSSGAMEAATSEFEPNSALRNVAARPPVAAVASAKSTRVAPTGTIGCRFCGGRLPDDRRVVFCPHCGVDQTKRQCPACSTELEASWRFCVTCGRSAELPEPSVTLKQAAG